MDVQRKQAELFIMSYHGKDQVDNAETFSTSCRFMTNFPCMVVMRPSDLDVMNYLKKLVNHFNLFFRLGSLEEFDGYRPCITYLIEL